MGVRGQDHLPCQRDCFVRPYGLTGYSKGLIIYTSQQGAHYEASNQNEPVRKDARDHGRIWFPLATGYVRLRRERSLLSH